MNTPTSQYLDFIRFLAAAFVFLNHTAGHRISGGLLWQLGDYGHEAVIVFFVLSGFVIGYATDNHEHSATAYALARISRIYSVAIPALVLTFTLDFIAYRIDPSLYSQEFGFRPEGKIWQFLHGLFFTNELWGRHTPQGSNWSYWSLGYEVWYYVLFGIITFGAGWQRVLGMLAVCALTGPQICLMFPIWLLGLGGFRLCSRVTFPPVIGLLLFSASLLGAYCYALWHLGHVSNRNLRGFGELSDAYVVATLCFANIIGFRLLSVCMPTTENAFTKIIRWLAGATFSLYLFHEPIVRFLAALSPFSPGSLEGRCMVLGGTVGSVFLLAELTERRKIIWRRGISRGLASLADIVSRSRAIRRTPS